jgi:hypothetical protein
MRHNKCEHVYTNRISDVAPQTRSNEMEPVKQRFTNALGWSGNC